MHLLMISLAFFLAISLRWFVPNVGEKWQESWQRSLFFFLCPQLVLLMTAISVVWMGHQGQMFGLPTSWLGYLIAFAFLSSGTVLLLKSLYQARQTTQKIRRYSQTTIDGQVAKILEIDFPYIAQVGFWQSELIVSRGLLNLLGKSHLSAVLAHEQAHRDFHDTFWFFWLGWLRQLTTYLPQTEAWWQELLRLRELRADWQAAQKVDPLLLAESLVMVTEAVNQTEFISPANNLTAAFGDAMPPNRLAERIESLLAESETVTKIRWWNWGWIALTLLPLGMIPWHLAG